ncbi:MAG: hypothetical protein JXA44_09260 [Methanospirillaceae archaeon]|nr:hypothetical protein [Methanospirillaceae archaeon]
MELRFIPALIIFICCIIASSVIFSVSAGEVADIKDESDFPDSRSLSGELPWSEITLSDARTGEEFTLNSLVEKGQPVIMHTFAIWCSACSMQLKETSLLDRENEGLYPVVCVDIDPNEKPEDILAHVKKNDFSGYYAAAPREFSVGLAQDAGIDVLMQIPHTFILYKTDAYKLPAGVYPAAALSDIINSIVGDEI